MDQLLEEAFVWRPCLPATDEVGRCLADVLSKSWMPLLFGKNNRFPQLRMFFLRTPRTHITAINTATPQTPQSQWVNSTSTNNYCKPKKGKWHCAQDGDEKATGKAPSTPRSWVDRCFGSGMGWTAKNRRSKNARTILKRPNLQTLTGMAGFVTYLFLSKSFFCHTRASFATFFSFSLSFFVVSFALILRFFDQTVSKHAFP